MTDTQALFWVVMSLTAMLLVLSALLKANERRTRRKRRIVMMARPMTRYEREHR